MKFTLKQIADILEGKVLGDSNQEVFKLSKIEEGEKGSLSFLSNQKYEPFIYTTEATAVIVSESFSPEKEVLTSLIIVSDAYKAFSKLLEFYNQVKNNKVGREQPIFISETATIGSDEYLGAFSYIGEHVQIGNNVKIYPNSYIGDNVKIGDNTTIYAGVKIYSETEIGCHCKIHSGAVIGADGFGFAPDEHGEFSAVPQIGNVVIEDNVDIGANAAIDRATLGSTIIRKGVKLDNFVQVAHNVEIGRNTVIAASTGVAGSTKIGENCMIGGQVGIVGHLTLGNNLRIQAQSGVSKNFKDGTAIQGTPAMEYNKFNKAYVLFRNLPSLEKRVSNIEKK